MALRERDVDRPGVPVRLLQLFGAVVQCDGRIRDASPGYGQEDAGFHGHGGRVLRPKWRRATAPEGQGLPCRCGGRSHEGRQENAGQRRLQPCGAASRRSQWTQPPGAACWWRRPRRFAGRYGMGNDGERVAQLGERSPQGRGQLETRAERGVGSVVHSGLNFRRLQGCGPPAVHQNREVLPHDLDHLLCLAHGLHAHHSVLRLLGVRLLRRPPGARHSGAHPRGEGRGGEAMQCKVVRQGELDAMHEVVLLLPKAARGAHHFLGQMQVLLGDLLGVDVGLLRDAVLLLVSHLVGPVVCAYPFSRIARAVHHGRHPDVHREWLRVGIRPR
mmetsp:Transcript_92068/g.260114  ORF Transcript_92068/g.260114 Transcript_92068/m.260114 type:complete len:330 (-) Transcript_92068:352-1341(-)